ncbi:MAG: autotransporter domain-containing protein [Rhodobacteraceae bacterium]|nr:autotransporter domain-containing protein [Paracoccaceae bacterium]
MFLPVNVSAQDSWICPITNAPIPVSGNINCTVTAQTNDTIRISVSERVISTTVANTYGILARHPATGDINIRVSGGSITTTAANSYGILGWHQGTGNSAITVLGGSINAKVRTEGSAAHGIWGQHEGNGNKSISVTKADITTTAANSHGIYANFHTAANTGNIGVTVSGGSINTEEQGSHGIYGRHTGTGNASISVSGGSITTKGSSASGIYGQHTGTGNASISVTGGSITTEDQTANGILGWHQGAGEASISVTGGRITTNGQSAHGIWLLHQGTDIASISVTGGSITTNGQSAHGIYGQRTGAGNSSISVSGVRINTKHNNTVVGNRKFGIYGLHTGKGDNTISVSEGSVTNVGYNGIGIYGLHTGTGNNTIEVTSASIMTDGTLAFGIQGHHFGTGDITVEVTNASIMTEGNQAYGVYGFNQTSNKGNITIAVFGGSITTNGQGAHGIVGGHSGTGNFDISVLEKAAITTEGASSHGIYVRYQGTQATEEETGDAVSEKIAIDVAGGSITVNTDESYGIYVWHENTGEGNVSITTRDGHTIATEGANAHGIHIEHAGIGSSEVVVDNITANGVGAYGIKFGRLNDDGEIERVSAVSVDDDGNQKLLNEDGYRPQMVRINGTVMGGQEKEDGTDGAGVFMAGGGRVTIGSEGVLGAQSGIAILAAGVNPTEEDTGTEENATPRKLYVNIESMDDKPWERLDGHIVNEGGQTILAVNETNVFDNGRIDAWAPVGSLREVQLNPSEDFSTLDFSEEEDWSRRYQSHAGAYEALPGAVRRIDTIACHVPTQQNYIGVCGGRGQYTPDQTTTGMSYAYDQQALHGHIMRPLSEQVSGWAGLRQVSGEANVNIAAGSSRVTVRGVGVHGGVQVMGDTDLYGQAHFQWTRYTLNLSSGAVRGTTKGTAWSLGLEGGRHFRVDDETRVTGRGWLKHANVSVTPFEDSLGLRVSGQERQVIAGVGVRGERTMVQENEDRRVVLRGSAGIETAVSEASRVMVDDEELSSQAKATRLLLDVGGVLHQGDTTVHGMVYAHGLGADDTSYGLRLGLEWSF